MSDSQSFAQRRASGLSVRAASRSGAPPQWQNHSRKSSQSSVASLSFARPGSGMQGDIDDSMTGMGATNGLGSLADELHDGWDEEEGADEGSYLGAAGTLAEELDPAEDEGYVAAAAPGLQLPLSPSKRRPGSPKKHAYTDSAYDGSDYGDDADLEPAEGISPGLERQMADIEALARQGAEVSDPTWSRFATSLKELPSQLEIENNTGKLVTAYAAVTSQLNNQSRAFQTTTHSLVSPFSLPPDPDDVEEILPLVTELVTMLPKPPPTSLATLHTLNSQTTDLLSTLSTLSDTLYMVRQTASTVSRRMRAAKEFVETMRKENEDAEEGIKWLERGRWDQRIRNREARKTCEDVVSGFEEVCNNWRQRLLERNGGADALDPAAV